MNSTCYEITQYRLLPEASHQDYVTAVEALNALLPDIPGFVRRDVYYQDHSKHWIEVIAWENEEFAKQAEKTLMSHPACKQGFALIDMSTVTLEHYSHQAGISTVRS